jgi:hypothetical protein
VSGPVIVNNRDNGPLILGIVIVIILLIGIWWLFFADGNPGGNGGDGGTQPTLVAPQGS